jgi:hypothetical protein
MRRTLNVFILLVVAASPAVAAQRATTPPVLPATHPVSVPDSQQTRPPTSTPVAPQAGPPREVQPEPRAPALPGIPANIRLDITVTDTYSGTPTKKTVTMMVMNGSSNMIRTSNTLRFANGDGYNVSLNVDAIAAIYAQGLITLRLTFQYTPAQTAEATRSTRPADLNESLSVILQDGKPLMLSQSADPASERKVTLEATATVIR